MTHQYCTRSNAQLRSHVAVDRKPFKTNLGLSTIADDEKEDHPQNLNTVKTYKVKPVTEAVTPLTRVGERQNFRSLEAMAKHRKQIVNMYSKLQFCFKTSMESLFMAVELLDRYAQARFAQMNDRTLNGIAIACFMMALKYEQIYPPTLDKICSKLQHPPSFHQHVNNELRVLQELDYCLVTDSPISYFEGFPCPIDQEKRCFLFLYLELVAMNWEIKSNYTWNQVVDALKLLFRPLSERQSQVSQKVSNCLKAIMVERARLSESYFWLDRKYSDCRFFEISRKPCYLGEQVSE